MELSTAISLIEKGFNDNKSKQTWAELGCGSGLFTRALSTLLPAGSAIQAIDKDTRSIKQLPDEFDTVSVNIIQKDFVIEPLALNEIDGFLMANSLHYVRDKVTLLETLRSSLKPFGRLIIIEYDRFTSNPWVPFPIDFEKLTTLALSTGFKSVTRIAEIPSAYNQVKMYSALLEC